MRGLGTFGAGVQRHMKSLGASAGWPALFGMLKVSCSSLGWFASSVSMEAARFLVVRPPGPRGPMGSVGGGSCSAGLLAGDRSPPGCDAIFVVGPVKVANEEDEREENGSGRRDRDEGGEEDFEEATSAIFEKPQTGGTGKVPEGGGWLLGLTPCSRGVSGMCTGDDGFGRAS